MTTWWACPNTPPCPHGAALHDVEDAADERPACCIEGCDCGGPTRRAERRRPVTGHPNVRALATHVLDQLDGATAELGHWLSTGERVQCPRCGQTVPAAADHEPVRHQLRGQWCTGQDGDDRD